MRHWPLFGGELDQILNADQIAQVTAVAAGNPPSHSFLALRNVTRRPADDAPLQNLSVAFSPSAFHVILGEEKSGKRTVFRLLGLLEPPDAGEVFLFGASANGVEQGAAQDLRARRFGFVFAAPFLLSSFSVVENVAMPLFKISQVTSEEARTRTDTILAFTGLSDLAEAAIDDLSMDAQFRTALARGLVHEPPILLVEDLDGALAGEELCRFADLLRAAAARFGTTVIATASPAYVCHSSDRVIAMADGAIQRDSGLPTEPET